MTPAALLIVLLTATALPSITDAQTITIGPLKNTNPKDVSSLTAQCEESADGQRLTCEFVQVAVSLKKSPDAAQEELAKLLQQAKPQEFAAECKQSRKEWAEIARNTESTNLAPRVKQFFTKWWEYRERMCTNPTLQTIRDFLWHPLENDTKTCRIWTNPWRETFKKEFVNKWVSNRGPAGFCGVVTVSTLQLRPFDKMKAADIDRTKNPHTWWVGLWTFETQRIVTANRDKLSELSNKLCSQDADGKVIYASDAKDFDRACEFIEFGM